LSVTILCRQSQSGQHQYQESEIYRVTEREISLIIMHLPKFFKSILKKKWMENSQLMKNADFSLI
jgi:hypothetical protein